jgi:hypothetical protein
VRRHARRERKSVIDLSTGETSGKIPIFRVRFCTGGTASLPPAELWRGRFTLTSVLETGLHIFRDGIEAAYDWTWQAGRDGSPVSPRTLRRWREAIRSRVIGAAWVWLAPQTGLSWSDTQPEAPQLEALLESLTPALLLSFRSQFGRALIDPAIVKSKTPLSDCAARPIPGRPARTSSHDPPCPRRPRGAWSSSRSRTSPPGRTPDGGPAP